jgi:hypothetical protein
MAADEGHFGYIQALLEKPTDGLVPQIVNPQVFQPGTLS